MAVFHVSQTWFSETRPPFMHVASRAAHAAHAASAGPPKATARKQLDRLVLTGVPLVDPR